MFNFSKKRSDTSKRLVEYTEDCLRWIELEEVGTFLPFRMFNAERSFGKRKAFKNNKMREEMYTTSGEPLVTFD